MKVVLERRTEYVPEWSGNRDAEKPVTFVVRYLTTSERHRYAGQRALQGILEQAQSGNGGSADLDIDFEGMFRASVESIRNLEVEIDGNVQQITTPDQLLDLPSMNALFFEVAMWIATSNARSTVDP